MSVASTCHRLYPGGEPVWVSPEGWPAYRHGPRVSGERTRSSPHTSRTQGLSVDGCSAGYLRTRLVPVHTPNSTSSPCGPCMGASGTHRSGGRFREGPKGPRSRRPCGGSTDWGRPPAPSPPPISGAVSTGSASASATPLHPAVGQGPETGGQEEIAAGLDIRLVHLAAEPLTLDLLGRRLDLALLAELERRSRGRAHGPRRREGGEFESLVSMPRSSRSGSSSFPGGDRTRGRARARRPRARLVPKAPPAVGNAHTPPTG